MRWAARVDANHSEIREFYRALGFSTLDIFQLKKCADIVVCKWGITDIVEVKDGSKPLSKRKLTKEEQDFHNAWNGRIWIVESVDDVLKHHADVQRRWDAMP